MRSLVDDGLQMQELLLAQQYLDAFTKWMTDHVDPIARVKYPLEWATWRKELDLIRGQIERPEQVRIALVGTTGAGKSSFLNAVLDQELLPVGVMEPCTAFVTLVRYRGENGYQVTVDFITEEEWRRDLESLVVFLKPGDEDGDPTESKRLINAAKKRVQAVLGIEIADGTSVDGILARRLPPEAQEIFRAHSSQSHAYDNAKDMLQHLRGLIRGDSMLWPLVKQDYQRSL